LAGRRWLSLVLALPTVAIVVTFAPLFFPNRQTPPASTDFSLKGMSFNLHGLREIDGIVEVIRQEQPDILLIQEYSAALVSPSFHGLDDLYPALSVDVTPGDFGQAIFSRYPLKRVGAELGQGRAQKILVETQAGPIAIWNVHPIPPYLIPPELYDAQISALLADLSTVHGPLILGGDFNVTDQSTTYRRLTRYLKDAYWEAGQGFGFSYPAPPYTFMDSGLQLGPLWRIDHLFHSQDFVVNQIQTLPRSGGSDHFPVVAILSWMK
jgi:endonuclease/exonuclease/phosphatase (EEP) superfamily protein YafD